MNINFINIFVLLITLLLQSCAHFCQRPYAIVGPKIEDVVEEVAQSFKIEKTYTVKKGDNLSFIAKKVLGQTTDWKKILALNSDIIKNSNIIHPGMKLKYADEVNPEFANSNLNNDRTPGSVSGNPAP
jgi:LysM repeat protein